MKMCLNGKYGRTGGEADNGGHENVDEKADHAVVLIGYRVNPVDPDKGTRKERIL